MRAIALLSLLAAASLTGCNLSNTAAPASPEQNQINGWQPQVAVVFPVPAGEAKSSGSYQVNVSVWPANRVVCDTLPKPPVQLFAAHDFDPMAEVDPKPTLGRRTAGTVSFPTEEFNGVSANMIASPDSSFSFLAFVRGRPASNVWLYGKPPAKYVPVKPTGYASPNPSAVDTRIQVVFPHDEAGHQVASPAATRLNIAVDIFQHGTTLSVPPDANYTPRLWRAEGSSQLAALPPGVVKTTYTVNGQGYPRWVFNDVQVEPGKTYHFLAMTAPLGEPGGSYPTVWTHGTGSKAPPKIETPPSCIP